MEYGSVYFVLGPSEHGTPTFPLPPLFSKVLSIQSDVETIFKKSFGTKQSGNVGVPYAVETLCWFHKELSQSYREGTTQKLKSMALPYKTEVWQKS